MLLLSENGEKIDHLVEIAKKNPDNKVLAKLATDATDRQRRYGFY